MKIYGLAPGAADRVLSSGHRDGSRSPADQGTGNPPTTRREKQGTRDQASNHSPFANRDVGRAEAGRQDKTTEKPLFEGDKMSDLIEKMEQLNSAHSEFMSKFDARLGAVEAEVDEKAKNEARQGLGTGSPAPANTPLNLMAGEGHRCFAHNERMADHYRPTNDDQRFSLGDFVKGSMGLPVKAQLERGTATVPEYLSAEIYDAIREKARLIQAGAQTVSIEGKTTFARIDTDPAVHEHTEGADDIAESVPVFAGVEADPKALVALIPLTMEHVADAQNLDAALSMSLARAFALKLDQLAIAKILADASIPTSAAGEATDAWSGILAAVGSMLGQDMPRPGALIGSPADYITRAGEGSTDAWLGAPPVLANMLDLETGGMTDGTAILGGFENIAIAVRSTLRMEVIRWQQPTKASHLLVAYARMEGFVMQPNGLYIQQASVT